MVQREHPYLRHSRLAAGKWTTNSALYSASRSRDMEALQVGLLRVNYSELLRASAERSSPRKSGPDREDVDGVYPWLFSSENSGHLDVPPQCGRVP